MHDGVDFYRVLEVEPTATTAEVGKAYRRLVIRYHPDHDRCDGAEDRMRLINEAYAVLKDPEQRQLHDQERPATPPLPARWEAPQAVASSRAREERPPPPREPATPAILFCEAVDELFNPVGIAWEFPERCPQVVCFVAWQEDLAVGTEVKVMWYVDDAAVLTQRFRAPAVWDHVAATLIPDDGCLPPGFWTVYVARDGRAAGDGCFVVRASARRSWWSKLWQRQ